jgi:hypothetical protein
MRMNAASSYLHSAGRGVACGGRRLTRFVHQDALGSGVSTEVHCAEDDRYTVSCMDGLIAAELPGQTGISPITYCTFRAPPLVKDTYP